MAKKNTSVEGVVVQAEVRYDRKVQSVRRLPEGGYTGIVNIGGKRVRVQKAARKHFWFPAS